MAKANAKTTWEIDLLGEVDALHSNQVECQEYLHQGENSKGVAARQ